MRSAWGAALFSLPESCVSHIPPRYEKFAIELGLIVKIQPWMILGTIALPLLPAVVRHRNSAKR